MQHAKHLGGNNFQFYNDQLQAGTLERLQLEQQLRRAIEEGQLEAYYQPKLCIIRWENQVGRGLGTLESSAAWFGAAW